MCIKPGYFGGLRGLDSCIRFARVGMLAEGLKYVWSWVEADCVRCFQLMECDDASLFQKCVIQWQDLIDFEIVPVIGSEQSAKTVEPFP